MLDPHPTTSGRAGVEASAGSAAGTDLPLRASAGRFRADLTSAG